MNEALDQRTNISPILALEFEGRAANAGLSAEDFLRELLDRPHGTSERTSIRKERIRDLHQEGLTDKQISEILGMSPSGVGRLRRIIGLLARRSQKTRRKTHDKYGHPFDRENTYVNPTTGTRHCRICMRENAKKQSERRKRVREQQNRKLMRSGHDD